MAADTVQLIKDRLNIVDVVGQYVKLQRAGQNYRARCPFHAERTPSFMVSPDRGTYHCFGCSVGGDIFSFVEAIEGVDFKGALKMLAEKAGVPLVYAQGNPPAGGKDETDRLFEAMETATLFYQRALTPEARAYLGGRGISEQTITAFRVGVAGDEWDALARYLREKKFSDREIVDAGLAKKGERGNLTDKFRNRIMFPISDTAGRVVAFSGRTFGPSAHPDAPKYLNSPETMLYHKSRILYGFDRAKHAIRKHTFAVLVEGQMDLIASHQAGWSNTVAVSGTAFTTEHALLIKRMSDNLLLALDPDEAGFKAATRAARAALQQGLNVKVAPLPPGLDPADLIQKEGADAWKKVIREAKDIVMFLLDVLEASTKAKDAFRRSVESIVIPFLADVQSPIAREQYEKEIADRLGVSARAVAEASAKVKAQIPVPKVPETPVRKADAPNRIKQAYGLLLWQESMKEPLLDTDQFAKDLEDAIGKEAMDELRRMPLETKETLRFFAEQLHGHNGTLKRDAATLIAILSDERLRGELAATRDAMLEAERKGDEAAAEDLSEKSRLLTAAIAKSGKKV